MRTCRGGLRVVFHLR